MKILQMFILSSFLINMFSVRDIISSENAADAVSVAVSSQTTLLYCTSMSFVAMKLVSKVYVSRVGMLNTGQETSRQSQNKKKSAASSGSNLFLLPGFTKLDKSISTATPAGNTSGVISLFKFDRAASVKFDLMLWAHIAPLLIIFQFFMLPRGSISDHLRSISNICFLNSRCQILATGFFFI